MVNDNRGPVFVSYRRSRLRETDALIAALRNRGLPTWRDVDDLEGEPTEAAIRAVLNAPSTSGAILWLTPDVAASPIIKDVEVPEAVRRYRRGGGFWLIVVLAGGLDYADVTDLFADSLSVDDLAGWNLVKVSAPWATDEDVRGIAISAVRRRVSTLSGTDGDAAFRVSVHAKGTVPLESAADLSVDWTKQFAAGAPDVSAWQKMVSAGRDVAIALKQLTSASTGLQYEGTPSIPVAMLLGSMFSTRDGRVPSWLQRQPDGVATAEWNLQASPNSSLAVDRGWEVSDPIYRTPSANALAVCVNVSGSVDEAFARSRDGLPPWRVVLKVGGPQSRNTRTDPLSPEEAASIAHLIVDAVRATRTRVVGISAIHFFIAGPAGLAFMLGTVLSTLPPVMTYEWDPTSGLYVAGVKIET